MTGHALAVAATVSSLIGLAPDQAAWITYASAEGRYSISLPGQPQERSEELNADGTPFLQHTAQLSAAGAVFMAVWADPPIADTVAEKDAFVDSARKALIATVKGTQLSSGPSHFGEQGVEYTISIPSQTGERFVRVRMFFIGRRAYTLVMMTRADADRAETEKRFFESFRIIAR